jgi:hypothetical protein
VDAEDLLQSAHKLHASQEDILQLLERSGFAPDSISLASRRS